MKKNRRATSKKKHNIYNCFFLFLLLKQHTNFSPSYSDLCAFNMRCLFPRFHQQNVCVRSAIGWAHKLCFYYFSTVFVFISTLRFGCPFSCCLFCLLAALALIIVYFLAACLWSVITNFICSSQTTVWYQVLYSLLVDVLYSAFRNRRRSKFLPPTE